LSGFDLLLTPITFTVSELAKHALDRQSEKTKIPKCYKKYGRGAVFHAIITAEGEIFILRAA
jgi:hypothetical protein